MNFDLPAPADNSWLLPLFRAASRHDWTEEELADRMAKERGVVRVERPRLFCSIEFYELEDPIVTTNDVVVIPAGMATQVKALLPQHNNQQWVDRTLAPLLTETLVAVGERWPEALAHPTWAWMDLSLANLWGNLFNDTVTPHGSRAIMWLPTLQEAIDKALTL